MSLIISLKLPVTSKCEDPIRGLAFDFLAEIPTGPPVLTGHMDGVITLNVVEAEDWTRETIRTQMHEPYRTLVGHFRHELGHYYWHRLVEASSTWLDSFRDVFGDEREDYAGALHRNYSEGPKADWASNYVSAYASIHPWEDWAETWSHYLHMIDTVTTAVSFGLNRPTRGLPFDRFKPTMLYRPDDIDAAQFLSFLNLSVELTALMNELSRSMGQHDLYPFALPTMAVAKLQFIHILVTSTGTADSDRNHLDLDFDKLPTPA